MRQRAERADDVDHSHHEASTLESEHRNWNFCMTTNIAKTLETLHRLAAPVVAVTGGVVNRFSRVLDALRRVADRLNAPIAVVGGLAAIHHHVPVATLDVDIVVDSTQLERFLQAAEQEGLTIKRHSTRGWHVLEFVDVEGAVVVEVIPSGETTPRDPAYAPPTPTPQELGVTSGLDFAEFAPWVALKLVANRDKDRYHITESLKHATPGQVAAVVVRLRTIDPSYLREFERLLKAAESERHDSW